MCSEKEVATEIPGVGIGSTHEIGLSDPIEAKLLVCQPYLLKRKGRTVTLLTWWPEIRLLVSFTRQAERKTTGAVYLVGYP